VKIRDRELAELLGLKPGTVLHQWETGKLPSYKLAVRSASTALRAAGIVWATRAQELVIFCASRDVAGSLLRGACRNEPNDSGESKDDDDDRADETGSWQEGGEEDGQGDRADDDEGDCAHAASWFPEPVGRKRPAELIQERARGVCGGPLPSSSEPRPPTG
jgi:hypothetical protein